MLAACLNYLSAMQRKHRAMRRYLRKNYRAVVEAFRIPGNPPEVQGTPYPVWICWWQGQTAMPPLVKACYRSVLRNAGSHPVHLLTEKNYTEFVTLPDFILDKTQKGCISLTHLSDILRMALLRRHGGLWLDATVFVSAPLPDFAGLKLFTLKRPKDNQYVAECRWSAYLFYMTRGCLLADFVYTLFLAYWRRENDLRAFFLIDYCIALAYDDLPVAATLLDAVPPSNPRIYALRKILAEPYAERVWTELSQVNSFHKLTWKAEFPERTADGAETFYGHLLK